jgi:GST-like protein
MRSFQVIHLYFTFAPNPMKVLLLLEEAGLEYTPVPVDTRKGEQFAPEFLAINPNGKVPAIVDDGKAVFDSNAILLYLAEKSGLFLGGPEHRHELLSWLMFIASGVGPFSGQARHFRHFVDGEKTYALNRYDFEANRHWKLIEDRLSQKEWLVGGSYSIADMACWGWARLIPLVLDGDENSLWIRFPNIHRLITTINRRPAAARIEGLKQRFTFKEENDAEARRHMFPQLARLKSG